MMRPLTRPVRSPIGSMATDAPSDPEQWLTRHGDYLYRCALLRVHDARAAEDVVQETLLAALQSRTRFAGRSSERSWLVGILKHKVIDHFRKHSREAPAEDGDVHGGGEREHSFDDVGNWHPDGRPKEWGEDPGVLLERKEFWDGLSRCLETLPPRLARVFSLRELDDVSTEEICQILDISANNLWVMLHRARMQLRRCLEMNCITP
ncbi:sigma-70 family RNA polymerase sigma factor [Candidatus Nitrospira bockiana]